MAFVRSAPVARKVGSSVAMYDMSNGLLRKLIPQSIQEQLKEYFLFRPNDPHDLHQTPNANVKMPSVPRIQGYRYPAPGSTAHARIPVEEDEDKKFDIKYFSRNT